MAEAHASKTESSLELINCRLLAQDQGTLDSPARMPSKVVIGVAAAAVLAVGIGVGILLGHFVTAPATSSTGENPTGSPLPKSYRDATKEPDASIASKFINAINADTIRSNLQYLTNKSHVAGSAVSLEQAEWVRDKWLQQSLDSAKIVSYNVLLSYPPESTDAKQNKIELLSSAGGSVDKTTQKREPPLDPDTDNPVADPDVLAPFNAYSADGEIEGDLVYVNYGRVEDFIELERVLQIDVRGKICIARYAKIYRGDKASNAQNAGCIGLILYSDPSDYAVPGAPVYPKGIYLPGTGTQRGSLLLGSGDPRTPGYPAVDYAYRIPISNLTTLPKIPVHPIGYNDAADFLKIMGGNETSEEWAGNLTGVTFRYGPGFNDANIAKKVKMSIYTVNKMANSYNVIGTIRGSVEPDRYVIIGNHRDAWGYGAIDPSSGTSCLMEMSRVFGALVKDGWRPRRTLMFGSWGAEEYGLIGSNEWVEEYAKNLGARTVAYLNLDIAVSGTHVVQIGGTPNLYSAIYSAARKIPDPKPEGQRQTVYDTWKARERAGLTSDGQPKIKTLGSGSDYAPFLQLVGISAADFTYTYDESIGISGYPMYHSVYETFKLVDRFYDPGFIYHRAITQLLGELARNLAESILLPMNVAVYAEHVKGYFENLRNGTYGKRMIKENISFNDMEAAVNNLMEAANKFVEKVDSADKSDVLLVRRLNDQMTLFERAFSDPQGLPNRPFVRHIVFAPSSRDNYASDKFPGIVDAMFDIDNNEDPEKWELVKKQLSVATFTIESAASVLMNVA